MFPSLRTIAARLTLTFVVAGLSITFLSAFVSEYFLRTRLEAEAQVSFEHYAKLVATKLSRDRAERVEDLRRISTNELLLRAQTDVERVRSYLERTREVLGLAWLGIADPTGRVVAASGGHLEGTSVAQTSWFIEGRTQLHLGSDLSVAALAEALGMNERFLAIAMPYKDAEGNIGGVLGAQQFLTYSTENNPLPPGAARDGIFASVYAGDNGRWLLGPSGTNGDLPLPAPRPIKNFRYWRENHEGVDYIMGFARTSEYRGVRSPAWVVAVRQPAERVYAPARVLGRRIVLWGSGLTLLVATSVAISVRKITARIRSIANSATHIRRGGDRTAILPIFPGQDDLSRMSVTLHELVEHLRNKGVTQEPKADIPRAPIVAEDAGKEYVRPSGTDPRRVVW